MAEVALHNAEGKTQYKVIRDVQKILPEHLMEEARRGFSSHFPYDEEKGLSFCQFIEYVICEEKAEMIARISQDDSDVFWEQLRPEHMEYFLIIAKDLHIAQ